MEIVKTVLQDVKLLRTRRFCDDRGWFAEVFSQPSFTALGLPGTFLQDNQSFSRQGVLRGLHYQLGKPQGKLVRCTSGHIWDVAVDLRRSSPSFGQWAGFDLRPLTPEGEMQMLWIPEGFAHGFLVLSETAEVLYKTTDVYHPAGERCVHWNDPALRISWPVDQLPGGVELIVNAKDQAGLPLDQAELPEDAI